MNKKIRFARKILLPRFIDFTVLIFFVSATLLASIGNRRPVTFDGSFRPIVSGAYEVANSITERPDGRIVVAGGFTIAGGRRNNMIGVLTPTGSADSSFGTGRGPEYADGSQASVFSADSQSTNKVIVGGNFNLYDGISRSNIARLNSTGAVDTSFVVGQGFNSTVMVVKVLSDNKILVGGSFNRYNGQNVRPLVRLNSDGSLDASFFATPITSEVRAIAVRPDGRVVAASGASVVSMLASGASDPSSAPVSGSSTVYDVKIQGDGKVVAVGSFATFGGQTRRGVARINQNGVLDAGFVANVNVGGVMETVYAAGVQSNGQILLGGAFQTVNSSNRRYLARVNADGSLDTTFNPDIENTNSGNAVYSILVRTDQSVLIGGSTVTINQLPRVGIALINPDGTVSSLFAEGVSDIGLIERIVVQTDGRILLGGSPTHVNGIVGRGIARIDPNGSSDASFMTGTGVSGYVSAIGVQNDGKIIIGGRIDSYNGVGRGNLTRLNSDGTLDPSFPQGVTVNDSVSDIAIQSDGKILCAGTFFRRLIRLNPDGTRDTGFVVGTGVDGAISAIAVQPNGKIIIAGGFSSYNGTPVNDVARLNADGTIDATFAPPSGLSGAIYDTALQSDGKIMIVGQFPSVNGVARNNIARLNSDGTTDLSFDPGSGADRTVRSMVVQADGRLILGGDFDSYNGVGRSELARVTSTGQLDQNFAAELDLYFYDQLGFGPRIHSMALSGNDLIVGGIFSEINGEQFGSVARYSNVAPVNSTLFDYDGDTRADLSVRRPTDNIWYLLQGTAGFTAITWGEAGDRMAPADYDGDGKTDVAVFRPSTGQWYVVNSSNLTFVTYNWGQDGDLPVPTDRDNDGRSDLVLFRPSNNTWYPRSTATGPLTPTQFGEAGDKPMVGDFDADGIGDIALFRPSNNNWYIIKSSLGYFVQTWGEAGDIPTTGDFDGDGATDQAVFRPSTGQWFLSRTTAGFSSQFWGQNGDIPVAADYDGDGKTDVAVFRPANATWYIVNSTAGIQTTQFGQTGDVPTQSAFLY